MTTEIAGVSTVAVQLVIVDLSPIPKQQLSIHPTYRLRPLRAEPRHDLCFWWSSHGLGTSSKRLLLTPSACVSAPGDCSEEADQPVCARKSGLIVLAWAGAESGFDSAVFSTPENHHG